MNYQDRIVGGGLPSLMGQGDINTPGAFQFAQKSEPVVRYAVGGDVSGYQNQDDPYGLDRNLFMPQQPAQQPVAPQTPVTPFGQQQMLDVGQRTPVVRPDVQAPVAQQPVAQPVAQAPAQRRGHEEIQGSGDNAYSSWVWDEPDPNEVQQYVGKNYDVVNTPFDWAKHGFKGDAAVYGDIPLTQDEQGNVSTYRGVTGSTKEFDDWLASQGFKTAYTLSGKSGNQTRTDYLLDKAGNVIDTKQTQVDLGSTGFLDKLAAAMPAIIVGLGTGGLGLPAWAAGAAAGAAAPAMKGFVEGQNLGDVLKTTGKGALLGAIGGQASSYLNPAAAEFGKAIGGGNEFLTKLATDAASGAGRGLVGSALTGGKNLGESVLMGAAGSALGGAANTAMGEAAGAAGIPPEVMRVLGPTGMAALTGKDWRLAGLTSLIGSLGQDAAQQAALEKQAYESKTDTGDEFDRLLKRYPGQEETQQLLGGSPLTAGMSLASIQPALDALNAAGQKVDLTDIGKLIAGQTWGGQEEGDDYEELLRNLTGTNKGDGNLEQDFVVTDKNDIRDTAGNYGDFNPTTGEWQPYAPMLSNAGLDKTDQIDIEGKRQQESDGLGDWTQFLGNEDDLTKDPFPYDTFTGNAPEGTSSGNLEEDFVVDENGNLRSTYTGEIGTFQNGKFVPSYTAPKQTTTTTTKSPGGSPTKTATGTSPTAKSTTPSSSTGGMDINSLLALLALMGGDQQQAAPVQPLFRSDLDVNKIFKNWMV